MQLTLTPDQRLIRDSIRDFAQRNLASPHGVGRGTALSKGTVCCHGGAWVDGDVGALYGGQLTYYNKMAIEELAKVCGPLGCRWRLTTACARATFCSRQ